MNKYPIILDRKLYDKFKIKSTMIRVQNKAFELLNYDKSVLCFNDKKNSIYRNIIFSYPEKKMLSFMNPKCIPMKLFVAEFNVQIKQYFTSQFQINEYIEGNLLNLFFDDRINCWLLATKFKNARKGYVLKPSSSIYQKFIYLLKGNDYQYINDLYLMNFFNKNYNFNFKICNDKLYLISVYLIENIEHIVYIKNVNKFSYEKELESLNGIIYFPKEYYFSKLDDILIPSKFNSNQMPLKYILTHVSGMQTKIESSDFDLLKKYDSVPHNILYMYFCLKKINKNQEYTDLFPRFKEHFINADNMVKDFIHNIHNAYIHYYILKNDDYKECYLFWAHKIHKEIFIPSLKISKIKITYDVIRNYFFTKHPREVLYVFDNCFEKLKNQNI